MFGRNDESDSDESVICFRAEEHLATLCENFLAPSYRCIASESGPTLEVSVSKVCTAK